MPPKKMQRKGKKRVRVAGRQLEASVHTSLPPHVQGTLRAYVKVCVSAITWEYSIAAPASKLCVGMRWWGEDPPGTIFRVPVLRGKEKCSSEESTTLAFYPVRSALPQLKAYLNDMKALKLCVGLGHMTEESMVIGRCTLPDLSALSESEPYEDSLPITSPQGHVLGRLHIKVAIEVARAGQTHLMAPAAVGSLPGFTVGPGASLIAKRSELQELHTEPHPGSLQTKSTSTSNVADSHRSAHPAPPSEAVATHKAALLAKYIDNHYTEPSRTYLGPKQHEVIAELIERGERLRDAMVASVLNSGRGVQEEVGGGRGGEGRGVKGMELGVRRYEDVCSSDDERVGDGEMSMDESDYPLRDLSLLEQLLYTKTTSKLKQSVDSAVQTCLPVSPSTSPHHSKPLTHPPQRTSPLPTVSSPTLPPSLVQDGDSNTANVKAAESGSSLTTLASFFSGNSLQKSVDVEILQAVGMERLTLLGRVTSCRVVIESLVVDPEQLSALIAQSRKTCPHHPESTAHRINGTFFVEYHFPAPMAAGRGRQRSSGRGGGTGRGGGRGRGREGVSTVRSVPPPREVVRVASKKIKNGVVRFGHRSVFPVSLVGQTTRQWWHDVLIFSVYYRHPTDRTPFCLGKARVPLRQWLMARSSSSVKVAVMSSIPGRRGEEGGESVEKTLGKLTVCVQLLYGRGEDRKLLSGDVTTADSAARRVGDGEGGRGGGSESERKGEEGGEGRPGRQEDVKWSHDPQFKVKEPQTISAKGIDKLPHALQLLLMIPEASGLSLPATTPTKEPQVSSSPTTVVPPNCYLVCRLFCAKPHTRTSTVWASSDPHFNFKQVFSLYLTPALLEQVCNNFTVVEVWHKTPGTSTDDELLGLVKLSLHQFYLAFCDDSATSLCLQADLPVVAVDSYCPVISPFTGNEQGHLAVLLAMGSTQQITTIQQQFAAGSYILHRPYSKSQSPPKAHVPGALQSQQIGRPNEESCEGAVHHTFDVTVSGVRGLSVFNSTVWGEADCFVQYHFPHVADQPHGEEGEREREKEGSGPDVSLQPCRTDMTLCVPNPTFSHETRHSLSLPFSHLVQRVIMTACQCRGGVSFELWRRFYYPNIRDQLIAKASLPMAKLCALVSMQRMEGPTVQSFSLPMTLVTKGTQSGSGGLLEVTVQYQALMDGRSEQVLTASHKKTHVTLTVEVCRATGLKDAALLAAQEQPVPLGFAAEVGTNNYAKISFPDLLAREQRSTKTVLRSFSPDFSHSFDFALPMVSRESIHPYTVAVSLAQRLAECSAVVEIWHKVPKSDTRPAPVGGAVFGHRLVPAYRDVCLGQAVIPLIRLLERQTGVRGWFPLYPPLRSSSASDDPHTACCHVGAVELSLSFSDEDNRRSIITQGLEMGWKIPESSQINTDCLGELTASGERGKETKEGGRLNSASRWKFCVKVTELWVPVETVTIVMSEDPAPYLYCFLRYRFFNSDVVVSVPRALSYCREGRGCYLMSHHATLTITGSHELEWYVTEETMEVEVWSCPNRRRCEREGDQAGSEETLLGTAFICLQALDSGDNMSGGYPLFKAGEVSLGNQTLAVQIEKLMVAGPQEPHSHTNDIIVEVLDMSDGEEFVPLKPVSEGTECKSAGEREVDDSAEQEDGERFTDMFEARLVIHEALHLPMMTDKTQEKEWPPCAYVTLHPHPSVDKIVTEVIPSSVTPHWNHQCLTHIPNLYLDPHCPGLELQVWSGVSEDVSSPSGNQQDDSYIGCVLIDLSTLALGLPQISGWYNITDFGGQIQGQIKVSIVPSRGWSLPSQVSTSPLPHNHAMLLPAQSFASSADLLPQLCHSNQIQPAPSFMEKSSSVLFRKLRDNLNELDHINSSLRANVPVSDSTGVADLKSVCSQLTTQPPISQLTASTNTPISQLTASVNTSVMSTSSLLDYSSSGPTLEDCLQKIRVCADKYSETPATVVHKETTDSHTSSSPHKDVVEACETRSDGFDSHSSNLSSQSSSSAAPSTPTTPPPPPTQEGLGACEPTAASEANSLQVTVSSDVMLEGASSIEPTHSPASTSSHSLTDISTCSSHDDSSPVIHTGARDLQSNTVEDVETTTVTPATRTSRQPFVGAQEECKEQESEDERGSEGVKGSADDECVSSGQHVAVTLPHVQELHPGSGGEAVTVVTDQKLSSSQPYSNDGMPAGSPPTIGGATDQLLQPLTHSTSGHKIPEVRLPNFFMPPQELERTMRELRASALSRPPPRQLFERHDSPSEHRLPDDTLQSLSQSSAVRSLQDVNQFLKSRRATVEKQSQSPSDQQRTLSDKTVQRLSQIFTSQPLHTNSEH